MDDITIDAGSLLFAAEDPLAATGLLVPFGVEARSNLGRFTVDPGVFTLPADVTGMSVNEGHERERVVGGFTKVWEQPEAGILFAMRFADTDEGRAAADDARSGGRRNLSVEASDVRIQNGRAVAGRIFGAALVDAPAFAGATLLAAEDTPEPGPSLEQRVDALEQTVATLTPEPAPADEDTEPDAPAEQENVVTNATVPATLTASATPTKTELDANGVFNAIAKLQMGEDPSGTLLAALSDIKVSGAGALPAAGVLQPAWLGELWDGRGYQRKFFPLIRNGAIRAIDEKGFVVTGPAVQPWSGNKAEISSGTGTTSIVSATFQRWGIAFDIAREFFDIPGNTEVIEAFLRRVTESYAQVTDEWVNSQLVLAAGAPLAPDTYPTDYPEALGQLIQGISYVEAEGDTPTFAIANEAAWTELLYTPKDQVPEFVSFAFGTNAEGTADGRVRVVRGTTGIDDTPSVLVGSSAAAHVNELPGAAPLNLDALDIARGGVDRAVVGYTQFMADHAAGIVLVGTADA